MEYKYHYKGGYRVHVNGVTGFIEPDSEVISNKIIHHPHFEPLFEIKVEKAEEKVENKRKKK